jgi:hypothetical protein
VAGSGPFPGNDGQPGQTLGAGIGSSGVVLLLNSLLSTNMPGGNGYGTIIDGGYNLSSDASIPLGATSFTSTDPKLGTLTNNGGPTLTMALLTTNSPAYGAIPTNMTTFPTNDQRGVVRPQGTRADIGAFELATTPAIITPPQSQSQSFGGSVTFTVDATGASLRYQWRFNGANIVGALSSSYTLSNIAITNAGNYQVVITNTYGSVTSSIATLTVVPYLVAGLTNQEVVVNVPVTFSANAAGSQPLYYQWYFNATNVVPNATGMNLTISNAQLSDAGAYSVVITNVGGSVTSAPATLLVDSITVQPKSQTVPAGTTVALSVVATGTSLNYTWFFNGTQLPGVSSRSFSLTATTNTAGTYRVNVGNTFVTMLSDQAVLTVVVPTNTLISHTSVTSNQFNLVYQTQPSLSYVLQSKNSLLDPSWTPLQTNIGTGGIMTSSDWTTNQPNRFYRLLIQ